jgi:hypothetical protein
MLDLIESSIDEFSDSSYYLLLDHSVKEYAQSILVEFVRQCRELGALTPQKFTIEIMERILFSGLATLDLPLSVKHVMPAMIATFFKYLAETGKFPAAVQWEQWTNNLEATYIQRLRADGSVKGETFRKNYTDVNRNDPCPCGSGKKFKKCCMNLIAP